MQASAQRSYLTHGSEDLSHLNKSSWTRGNGLVMVSFCSKGSALKASNMSTCTAGARKDPESHTLCKEVVLKYGTLFFQNSWNRPVTGGAPFRVVKEALA